MAIPRDFINELVARTDIVELVGRKVQLKKAGKNYSACCPFHSEKTPSFTVSQDKQFYHCFGCGAHGNAIDFVMEYDRLEFVDAIEDLAGQLGLQVPREEGTGPRKDPSISRDLYELMDEASRFYHNQLKQHTDKDKVQKYLEYRDLSANVIEHFNIGFAPDGWDNLLSRYRQNQDAQEKLVTTGMVIASDNGKRYDRFRDRLMFPIRDRRGRVIGFGGRVLGDGTPKYLNSPETPIFHKGNELYGLYEVKQRHRNPKTILIVEGYMDVVALAQFDVDYAVASLGTSTTAEQLQLLLRNAEQIVCCYDGDRAGREAAWRALETALPLLKPGDQIRFMFLEQGEDPDSMVRKIGKEAFESLVENAQSLNDFLFTNLSNEASGDKGKLAKQALDLVGKIKDPILQNLLLENLSHKLGMNSSEELKKKFGFNAQASKANPLGIKGLKGRGTPLRLAIALLVQYPKFGSKLPKQPALTHLSLQGLNLLIQLLDVTRDEELTSAQLIELYRDKLEFNTLKKLAQWEHQVTENNLQNEFKKSLVWLNNQYLEQRYQELNLKPTHTKEERVQLRKLIAIIKSQK